MNFLTAFGVLIVHFLMPVVLTAEWKENKRMPEFGWVHAFFILATAAISRHPPLLLTFVVSGVTVGWIFSTTIKEFSVRIFGRF